MKWRSGDVGLLWCGARQATAHLLVINRVALPELPIISEPVIGMNSGWTTASWVDRDRVYLFACEQRGTVLTCARFCRDLRERGGAQPKVPPAEQRMAALWFKAKVIEVVRQIRRKVGRESFEPSSFAGLRRRDVIDRMLGR
ncbi:MAG: hypothetical protein M2R45_01524 [Verrucomicrobia subdivision 3 bacterium]|nr:hypothetical protein [Limisphaerales bacterium]MCS1413348.1 hypothetical protein [Limisphaerales bacterium]